jgi:VanZ family protein
MAVWRRHPLRLAAAWAALILALTMLPFPFVTAPGLAERKLAQFILNPLMLFPCRLVNPRDVVVNVLFFMPFGLWAVRAMSVRLSVAARVLLVCLAGFVLSVCAESIQLFAPGRFSSLSDVFSNTAGAALGAWIGVRRSAGRKIETVC